ncbi:alpha/beta hydrolase [Rugamonas sp. CCM 8940]|nr:alpha/beta hydrolase [Rugamonas sp. CCM 8940]MBJ7312773.1 alpha/beta hydrolase [Rugamonas sp. CCM 8940]
MIATSRPGSCRWPPHAWLARLASLVFVFALMGATAHAGTLDAEQSDDIAVKTVRVHGLDFPVLDVGEGPVVLLLHGFPDSHEVWRRQVGPLVRAGYRVVAPDLRGFGDAPMLPAVADYSLFKVLGDVVGLLDVLDIKQARVVGHDWGAVVSWYLAAYYPARVERLMVLSVGAPWNPEFNSIEQREKSWYSLFFQFEGVAEAQLRKNDWALLRGLSRNEGDIEAAIEHFARPGTLTAALNWYRANSRPVMPAPDGTPAPPALKVNCKVLGVWSERDHFLTEAQMQASAGDVSGKWRYERVEEAGHWMMLERPRQVTELMLDFLRH